jgi:phage-related protein
LSLSEDKILNITIEQKLSGKDTYICIDMRTHLIEGLDTNYKKTGMLYNRFITSGDFFLLPVGKNTLTTSKSCDKIEYNYLYY